VKITFDPKKREVTLRERGIDFADAEMLFEGLTFTEEDDRLDYSERRYRTFGVLAGRLMLVVWTPRGEIRHVISMRKCNDREKRKSRTDWAKVDAHVVTPEEYHEMPEMTADFLDRAEIRIGETLIRPGCGTMTKPGRPRSAAPKKSVHLRLSPDVLAHFRKSGAGWQTRIDEALRKLAKLPARKA
jgi:uncharacterized protein